MNEASAKRLEVLRGHLAASGVSELGITPPLEPSPTGAWPQEEGSYCVVLPENLTPQGPWLVRR